MRRMNGLAAPSRQNRGRRAGAVGSGRAAGWMGAAVTGIPGLGPATPFPTYSCPELGGEGHEPWAHDARHPCLVLEKGIQALMRTNGCLENSFAAPR